MSSQLTASPLPGSFFLAVGSRPRDLLGSKSSSSISGSLGFVFLNSLPLLCVSTLRLAPPHSYWLWIRGWRGVKRTLGTTCACKASTQSATTSGIVYTADRTAREGPQISPPAVSKLHVSFRASLLGFEFKGLDCIEMFNMKYPMLTNIICIHFVSP